MPPRSRVARGRSPPAPDWILAGRIWWAGRLRAMEIGLSDDGWIRRVGRSLRAPRRVDLGESVILPSGTDLHVHFREPGGPDAADSLASGTLQAVHGGIALVGDMPNTSPPVRGPADLEAKAARVPGRAACDVVLYGLAQDAASVRRLGATAGALKVYLAPTTGVDAGPSPSALPDILSAARSVDLPVSVHAEDPRGFRPPVTRSDDPAGWDAERPETAEASAVRSLLAAAGGTRLNVAHVTQGSLAGEVRLAGFASEVTPQHLLLSTARAALGSLGKVNPPLRGEATRAALFEAFRSGFVTFLASDHAPHAPEAKGRPFALAPSGMPGVETMLPLLLERVRRAELPLAVLIAAAMDRPARWLGRPLGRIAPGHRASLLAVDFRRHAPLRERTLHAPAAATAFEGWEAVFPHRHYVAGELAVDDGEYVGGHPGRVVRPEFARA